MDAVHGIARLESHYTLEAHPGKALAGLGWGKRQVPELAVAL
jgi:hypothetical protein